MKEKNRIISLCCAFFLGLTLNGTERKPNIILIMADDASWECFGSYGAIDYETPRLDQMAAQGLKFEHCYSTPLCTPSRVKLMTGQYNFRNYTHFGYLNPRDKTFGHLLQENGYRTAIAGKWQLNGLYNQHPGHLDKTRPLKAGFHESLLWQVTKGKAKRDGGGERYWNAPLEHNGVAVTSQTNHGKYGPDLFTDFICDFMERNRQNPFFVYYPMVLVHDVFIPTPDSIGDMSLEEAMVMPKEPHLRKKHFVAMVNYMDKLVGKIVDKVEALGLAQDTLVLFTADNGTDRKITSNWGGMEFEGGKGGPTDLGTRVPLLAYWKGRAPAGGVCGDLIEFTDFYPTLADAAGIAMSVDDPIDGISFFPQLNGREGAPREWQLNHYQPYWGPSPAQYARTKRYKLYRDGRFFDVSEDLFEQSDLAHATEDQALAAKGKLSALLDLIPPVVPGKGNVETTQRPVFPGIRNLHAIPRSPP